MVARRKDLYANLAITADPRSLQRGLAQSGRSISRFAQQTNNSFARTALISTAAIASITIGATAMAKAIGDTADQIAKSGKALGFTSREYQRVLFAIQKVGGDLTNIERGILRFQKALAGVEGRNGVEVFRRLGLSIERFRELAPAEAFNQIVVELAKVQDITERNALTISLFGTRGSKAINLLVNDMQSYSRELDRAQKIGAIFSQETLDNAQETNDAIGDLVAVMNRGFADGVFDDAIERTKEWDRVMNALGDTAESVGSLVGILIDQVNDLVDLVDQYITPSIANLGAGLERLPTLIQDLVKESIGLERTAGIWSLLDTDAENFAQDLIGINDRIQELQSIEPIDAFHAADIARELDILYGAMARIISQLENYNETFTITVTQGSPISHEAVDVVGNYIKELEELYRVEDLIGKQKFVEIGLRKAATKGITDEAGRLREFLEQRYHEVQLNEQFNEAVEAGFKGTRRDLRELTKQYGKTYAEIQNSLGNHIKDLEEEFRISQLSEKQKYIELGLREAAAKGISDQNDRLRELLATQFETIRLNEAYTRAIEAGFEGTREQFRGLAQHTGRTYEEIIEGLENSTDRMQDIWENMVSNMQDEFADRIYEDLFQKGGNFFKNLIDGMKNLWLRGLAEMAAAWTTSFLSRLTLGAGGFGGLVGTAGASAVGAAAGSGGLGIGGVISGLGGLASTFSGGLLGSFGVASAQGLVGGAGFLGGLGSAFSAGGAGFFNVAGNAALAGGGFGATLGAAIPVLGAAALAISFFSSRTKLLDEGLEVTIDNMDTLVQSFRRVRRSRFWGLSRSTRETYDEVSDELLNIFTTVVDTTRRNVGVVLRNFDFATDGLVNFSEQFRISLRGLSEEERTAAIQEELERLQLRMVQAAFATNNLNLTLDQAEFALRELARAEETYVRGLENIVANTVQGVNELFSEIEDANRTAIEAARVASDAIEAAYQQAGLIQTGQIDALGAFHSDIGNLTTESLHRILGEIESRFGDQLVSGQRDRLNELRASIEQLEGESGLTEGLESQREALLEELAKEVESVLSTVAGRTADTLINLSNAIDDEFQKRYRQGIEGRLIESVLESTEVTVKGINDLARLAEEASVEAVRTAEEAARVASVNSQSIRSLTDQALQDMENLKNEIRDAFIKSVEDYVNNVQTSTSTIETALSDARRIIDELNEQAQNSISSPEIPAFATGGMVPGPVGKPVLAVVHGGEEVLTPAQSRNRGEDRNIIVNLNIEGDADSRVVRVIERKAREVAGILAEV